MRYYRILEEKLKTHFKKYKQAIVLLGARQVGKTTLLCRVFPNALYLLVDEKPIASLLETYSFENYKKIIKNHKQILIDEIHLIRDPGRAVKIIYDRFPGVQLIITGSSSLNIKNKTAESMAGRSIDYTLYPLTFGEYLYQLEVENNLPVPSVLDKVVNLDSTKTVKLYPLEEFLQDVLVYGTYPETLNLVEKQVYLQNLAQKAVFKDIVELNLIENRAKAEELLKLLAYQIGQVVNYAELSRRLGISVPTVQRYIEIFEQSFILFRVYPFATNKRLEIGKSPKIYFWDLGLRNAIINDFSKVTLRPDLGSMFENFIVSEIKKEIAYKGLNLEVNYWRIKTGAEIDLVLRNRNTLIGVEVKFSKGRITPAFKRRYPEAKTLLIDTTNFLT